MRFDFVNKIENFVKAWFLNVMRLVNIIFKLSNSTEINSILSRSVLYLLYSIIIIVYNKQMHS